MENKIIQNWSEGSVIIINGAPTRTSQKIKQQKSLWKKYNKSEERKKERQPSDFRWQYNYLLVFILRPNCSCSCVRWELSVFCVRSLHCQWVGYNSEPKVKDNFIHLLLASWRLNVRSLVRIFCPLTETRCPHIYYWDDAWMYECTWAFFVTHRNSSPKKTNERKIIIMFKFHVLENI